MKRFFLPLVLAAVSTATLASAQNVVDVNQPSVNSVMAAFSYSDLAQSFQPTTSNCSGGGVDMSAGWGVGGTFTIELWDTLPGGGGSMLATGSAPASPGAWVDVFWPSVPVTPGNTYYMVYYCTDFGMAINGDVSDPYAGGQVYANAGFDSFPSFDYTFNTWTDSGGGGLVLTTSGTCPGPVTIDVNGATPSSTVAIIAGVASSYTVPGGSCAGLLLALSPSAPGSTVFFLVSDSGGSLSLSPSLPIPACGLTMQAVDISGCAASNAVVL